nr:PREDICTED: uncharacterized protein LOC102345907 isoform X1 [Latimeria chalumnae]|eukprot:XP_014340450.1 PREDICTED: uncharacterized protein LOC102345907 isoform X1 [Latimeria chalumnae]
MPLAKGHLSECTHYKHCGAWSFLTMVFVLQMVTFRDQFYYKRKETFMTMLIGLRTSTTTTERHLLCIPTLPRNFIYSFHVQGGLLLLHCLYAAGKYIHTIALLFL